MFAERSLISTIVYKPNLFHLVQGTVKPEMFDEYRSLADAIWAISQKNQNISISAIESYSRNKILFEKDLKPLGQFVRSKDIEINAKAVCDRYYAKEFIGFATTAMIDLEEGASPLDTITDFTSKTLGITNSLLPEQKYTLSQQVDNVHEQIMKSFNHQGLTGYDTGIERLNKITGGRQPGGHTVIAGRPGMGKTALMLDFILIAIIAGVPSAIFSWEMTGPELIKRLISKMTGISSERMNNGDIRESELEEIRKAMGQLKSYPLHIVDNPGDINKVRSRYIILKKTESVFFFAFDFIQRVNYDGDDRVEITKISRTLSNLSKEHKTHNFLLSQLSRKVESRGGDKRPMLSDLKESGAIEEDAKIVIFPYRPEYYGMTEDDDGYSLINKAELIIPKNREGKIGNIQGLDFVKHTGVFREPKNPPQLVSDQENEKYLNELSEEFKEQEDDLPF